MLRLYTHLKTYGFTHRSLYSVSVMIFFWCIYDGIISYVTPLVLVERGLSNTLMGIILASSSVIGALFDMYLSKFLKNVQYRWVFWLMFSICAFYPLLLSQARMLWVFLLSMAMWGMYYDFFNFGVHDFVTRELKLQEHVSGFGVMHVFKALGYIIAPIMAGLLIGNLVGWQPFLLAWFFLVVAFIFYVGLIVITHHHHTSLPQTTHLGSFVKEWHLWRILSKSLLPLLILTTLFNVFDAFFWTIGPLFAEQFTQIAPFNGLFISVNLIPALLVGWFVGDISKQFGRHKTAFGAFLLGTLLFTGLFWLKQPLLILILIFVASLLQGLAMPVVHGLITEYIDRHVGREKEVLGVTDFSANSGYVIGPIMAGMLSDQLNPQAAFAILGVIATVVILTLLAFGQLAKRNSATHR